MAGNAEGNAEENAGDAANRAAACTIHGDLVPRTRAPAADSSRTAHGVLPGQAAAAASYAAPVAGSVAAANVQGCELVWSTHTAVSHMALCRWQGQTGPEEKVLASPNRCPYQQKIPPHSNRHGQIWQQTLLIILQTMSFSNRTQNPTQGPCWDLGRHT